MSFLEIVKISVASRVFRRDCQAVLAQKTSLTRKHWDSVAKMYVDFSDESRAGREKTRKKDNQLISKEPWLCMYSAVTVRCTRIQKKSCQLSCQVVN